MKAKTGLLLSALLVGLVCAIPMSAQLVPLATQSDAAPPFSYSGDTGPGFWAEASPACAMTPRARQSPIDIRNVVEDPRLAPLDFIRSETSFTMTNPGYTIRAIPRAGTKLVLDHVPYTLVQFHFHTLSEHTLRGRHAAMELHAVFVDEDGHAVAIGVLYRIGRPNRFLARLIAAGLPRKTTSPAVTINRLNIEDAFTDTASYYNYSGALTTPPCSPSVNFILLKRFAQMSPKQFEAFRLILGNNFRPLQALNGRVIRGTVKRDDDASDQDSSSDQ
ncbi:MAG: carbonic anhydrase family protein [Acidobacteriaceae bacterium]